MLTLRKQSVKLYTSDDILGQFYDCLHKRSFSNLHIPHSSVFYIRALIERDTGVRYSLKRVEEAMKAEGWED